MSADNRKYPREDTSIETIYYTEHTIDNEPNKMHYPGTIINISKGGVGMVANYPHQLKEQLFLEGIGKSRDPLPSRVQWIINSGDQYNVGIKFDREMN